jgi:hypothetical protein
VTLVRKGRPEATIVVADAPHPVPLWVNRKQLTVTYAAEELQRWIEKSSSASLPIVPASKAPATGTLVLVGQSGLSDRFGLRAHTQPEGLRIITFGPGDSRSGRIGPLGCASRGTAPADLWDYERCFCPQCQAAYRDDRGRFGKNSDLLFGHGVALAGEIRKRWPDKRLIMLAYEGHMLPPSFEIPDNIDIQLCMMWSSTLGKEDYWHDRNIPLIRSWSKKVGGRRDRLYVWNDYCWPSQWTAAPIFFPHSLQKWLQETYPVSGGEFINPGFNPLQYELFMC